MMFGLRKSTRVRLGRVRDVAGSVMAEFGASAIVTLLTVSAAHAAGSGMPWEAPLERILESVQGPVAKIVAVMIITVTGISESIRRRPHADHSDRFQRLSSVGSFLCILMSSIRLSIPKSVNAKIRSSPTP